VIIAVSTIIKILNSYFYFGFFSGDDVEIHEMTFSHLFNWHRKAWNLRSPFFPMVFIYPVQAFLFNLKIQNPADLIFAGRMVVVFYSAVNLYLVYKIVASTFNNIPIGIISVFLAISKMHATFASSELRALSPLRSSLCVCG